MPRISTQHKTPPGRVIWITGLSGSGKTTLSKEVVRQLKLRRNDVISLDGDELRMTLPFEGTDLETYDPKSRLKFAMHYANLSMILSKQGFIVVVATISMFKEVYVWNRANLPGYFEVYMKVPIEELRRRDSKRLYSRFDNGELQNIAGLDLPVDIPETPDFEVVIKSNRSLMELAGELITKSELAKGVT